MVHPFSHFIGHAIAHASGSTALLALVVMLCAFLLEDATTIIVGVLAADGNITIRTALIALYAGIIVGDIVLYTIGAVARTHPRLARYIDHDFTAPFRDWLEKKYTTVIFSGHFVPGLRLTTYIASGFFRFPLSRYIPLAIVSGLILETTLFTLSYLFGSFSATWVSAARWGVAGVFILILFLVARHNILSYRARRAAAVAGSGGDTHTR